MENKGLLTLETTSVEDALTKLKNLIFSHSSILSLVGVELGRGSIIEIKKIYILDNFEFYNFYFFAFLVLCSFKEIDEPSQILEMLSSCYCLAVIDAGERQEENENIENSIKQFFSHMFYKITTGKLVIEIEPEITLEPLINSKDFLKKFERC